MATGHVLPAQHEAVTDLHRAQQQQQQQQQHGPQAARIKPSFIPENNNRRWLLAQAPVASAQLEQIRAQARRLWAAGAASDDAGTSYGCHFPAKRLDEPTMLRPTSPHRRNNPHPPLIFLTCRMHNVPGFNNADSETDKQVYQVDSSLDAREQAARQQLKAKFANRPATAALRQYDSSRDPVSEVFGPKLDMQLSRLGKWDEDDEDLRQANRRMTQWQTEAAPSLHRHLRYQGPQERERLRAATCGSVAGRRFDWRQHQRPRSQQPARLLCSRRDAHPQGLVYQPTRVRGDFLIHPDWPPTLPHHRVP